MTTATALKPSVTRKQLPAPNSDFYQLADVLTAEEQAIVKKVRDLHGDQGRADHQQVLGRGCVSRSSCCRRSRSWASAASASRATAAPAEARSCSACVAMEMARVDASFAPSSASTAALRWARSISTGSEEQKQKWLPPMARLEKIGCFGLTEPLVGSGTGGGLTTTAKREGDTWILNGQKRWIGNAPWCDVSIIWARDVDDNQVKGFIVENKTTPGFSVEKIENKIALKVVQNGQITLKDCPGAGSEPPAGRQLVPRHRARAAHDALHGRLGGDRRADGRLRARAQVRAGAPAVRQADRLVPAGAGSARQDARQRHRVPMHDGAPRRRWRTKASSPTSMRRSPRRSARRKSRETVAWARELLRRQRHRRRLQRRRASSPTPRRSTPTRARIQMQNLIVGKAITGFSAFV